MTNSEKICNSIASKFFLNDFTFKNLYYLNGKVKQEICDGLIECGDIYLLLQVKERGSASSSCDETKWLEKKVYKDAVSQIKTSIQVIKNNQGLKVLDMYDQEVELNPDHDIIPIIVFLNDDIEGYDMIYTSSTALKINVFSIKDFGEMMDMLKVPIDIIDYLDFRMRLFGDAKRIPKLMCFESEDSVMISIPQDEEGVAKHFYMMNLRQYKDVNVEEFLFILKHHYDRMRDGMFHPQYKEILRVMVKFNRPTIKQFMERWECVTKREIAESPIFDRFLIFDGMGILFGNSKRGTKYDDNEFYLVIMSMFAQKFKLDKVMALVHFPEKFKDYTYLIQTMLYEEPYEYNKELMDKVKETGWWDNAKFNK